jgi:hypothetical protein
MLGRSPVQRFSFEMNYHRSKWSSALGLTIMTGIFVAYYSFFSPDAARKQRDAEHLINSIEIPAFRSQTKYLSEFKPSNGFVEKTVSAALPPDAFCKQLTSHAKSDGWRIIRNCQQPSPSDQRLTLFCEGNYAGSIYNRTSSSEVFVYALTVGWGAVNTEDCAR